MHVLKSFVHESDQNLETHFLWWKVNKKIKYGPEMSVKIVENEGLQENWENWQDARMFFSCNRMETGWQWIERGYEDWWKMSRSGKEVVSMDAQMSGGFRNSNNWNKVFKVVWRTAKTDESHRHEKKDLGWESCAIKERGARQGSWLSGY